MLAGICFLTVCFLAFTNGANANFKGVASLYGSGTTTLRRALLWGTATTCAGSLMAMFFSQELLKKFGGRGLVPDNLVESSTFVSAVALGAALTSFLATRWGFPVSTTHALVGALVGAGLAGSGSDVKFAALNTHFLFPLLFSPMVAALLGALTYHTLSRWKLAPPNRSPALDSLHYFSTGAASFARGLNDTPKIVALLLATSSCEPLPAFVAVAVLIALGGLIDARNVAETLGKKVTDLDAGQGLAVSLATAVLVTTASWHSYPVSTTHVSVGALLGLGVTTSQTKWRKVAEILVAWITTVPCGTLLAAIAYGILSRLS
jgi:PiT family inorganic phosphate transporter